MKHLMIAAFFLSGAGSAAAESLVKFRILSYDCSGSLVEASDPANKNMCIVVYSGTVRLSPADSQEIPGQIALMPREMNPAKLIGLDLDLDIRNGIIQAYGVI